MYRQTSLSFIYPMTEIISFFSFSFVSYSMGRLWLLTTDLTLSTCLNPIASVLSLPLVSDLLVIGASESTWFQAFFFYLILCYAHTVRWISLYLEFN